MNNMRTRVVLYVCMTIVLCNVGCENREDQKSGKDDAQNALVAVGTEDDDEDASVEGMYVRRIWSVCAFDQMRCASGKCAFDQSPNHDSNPNPNPKRNHNPIPNPYLTLNLTSTKCRRCMQVG